MKQKFSVGKALGIILLGAIIGGILGELFGMILPESVVREFLLKKYAFGFTNPLTIDLSIIEFSFSHTSDECGESFGDCIWVLYPKIYTMKVRLQ